MPFLDMEHRHPLLKENRYVSQTKVFETPKKWPKGLVVNVHDIPIQGRQWAQGGIYRCRIRPPKDFAQRSPVQQVSLAGQLEAPELLLCGNFGHHWAFGTNGLEAVEPRGRPHVTELVPSKLQQLLVASRYDELPLAFRGTLQP